MTTAATRFVKEILEPREDFRTFWGTHGIAVHGLSEHEIKPLNAICEETGENRVEAYDDVRTLVKQIHKEIAESL
jgi:hypothetical protein